MEIISEIAGMRRRIAALPRPIGFVPTMGALHAGHLALASAARSACASVVVSLFVNPLQFAPHEDLARYPRDLAGDCAKLEAVGTTLLFAPDAAQMYPPGFMTSVEVGAMGGRYEGVARPTHFRGVATVVAKLLAIVTPDRLYLGQKDAQQTAILRRMVTDLGFATQVEIVPTVREADGVAMSSRNVYLSAEERREAVSLHRALVTLRDRLQEGASKAEAIEEASAKLGSLARLEYLDVVDAQSFDALDALRPPAFVIGAARFGQTRLLDNLWIQK
ncbi:MAG: pantoate--beta-alanine ligase [Vulcanimicrobiaceae bacterium]